MNNSYIYRHLGLLADAANAIAADYEDDRLMALGERLNELLNGIAREHITSSLSKDLDTASIAAPEEGNGRSQQSGHNPPLNPLLQTSTPAP